MVDGGILERGRSDQVVIKICSTFMTFTGKWVWEMRGKALCEPQYNMVTMDRKRGALGAGEQHSRLQV